jgi:hypothetical protein
VRPPVSSLPTLGVAQHSRGDYCYAAAEIQPATCTGSGCELRTQAQSTRRPPQPLYISSRCTSCCTTPSPPTPKGVYVPGPRAQYGVPAQGKECFSTGRARSARDQSRSPPILEDYFLLSTVRVRPTRTCTSLLIDPAHDRGDDWSSHPMSDDDPMSEVGVRGG